MFLPRLSRCGVLCVSRMSSLPAMSRPLSTLSPSGSTPLLYRHFIKPLAFTLSVCGTSFIAATVLRYENIKNSQDKSQLESKSLQSDNILSKIKLWWSTQSEGFKIFSGIAFINGLVFLAWRIPQFQAFMLRYFVTTVEKRPIPCLPMLLSNFSHYELKHFISNMLILYLIADISTHVLGKEHLLALYLSSGTLSVFANHLFDKISFRPFGIYYGALGASGAIRGILAAICILKAETEFTFYLIPFITFYPVTALKGLILLDTIGFIFNFKNVSYIAHLSGTFFGILYAKQLMQIINEHQQIVINYWENVKRLI